MKNLEERNKQIVAAYNAGLSGPQIAKAFEVSHPLVYKILHENGVRGRDRQEQRDQSIVAAYVNGTKVKDIAAEHGVSLSTVFRIVRAYDTERRGHAASA